MIEPIKGYRPCHVKRDTTDRESLHFKKGKTPYFENLLAKVSLMDAKKKRRSSHYKMTAQKVRNIRRLAAEGVRGCVLAKKYHTSASYIYKIVKRIHWKEV